MTNHNAPQPHPLPTSYKTSKKVKIVLVISLAINLLIVGMVAGMIFSPGAMRHPDRNVRDFGFKIVANALSRADRAQLGRALREKFGDREQRLPEVRKQLDALINVLEAPEFDGARAEEILRSNALNIVPRQEAGLRLLIEKVKAMTPKQRQRYVRRLNMALRMERVQARRKATP